MNRYQLRAGITKLNGKVSQREAAVILGCDQYEISRCCQYFGIEWIRHLGGQDGEANHRYKDGLGRSTIERHTRSIVVKDGRSLIICERCGWKDTLQELPRHHKDRDRTNNTPSNIEVLCFSCHNKEHMAEKTRDELGRFLT